MITICKRNWIGGRKCGCFNFNKTLVVCGGGMIWQYNAWCNAMAFSMCSLRASHTAYHLLYERMAKSITSALCIHNAQCVYLHMIERDSKQQVHVRRHAHSRSINLKNLRETPQSCTNYYTNVLHTRRVQSASMRNRDHLLARVM